MSEARVSHHSRRALLAGALGALAGSVAHAIGRPDVAHAANGDTMKVGGDNFENNARTAIYQLEYTSPSLALFAYTYGTGPAFASTSVSGDGAIFVGGGVNRVGAYGQTFAGGTGTMGVSIAENVPLPNPEPDTGVFGFADRNASARGVFGLTGPGTGVRGQTTTLTGYGGRFVAPTGGKALGVVGRAVFSRSGVATVSAGRNYVDVTVGGGLPTGSTVLATIQGVRSGTAVSSVRLNYPSAGKARIYLTRSVTSSTKVAWFALG
jgi:hypothetical protein